MKAGSGQRPESLGVRIEHLEDVSGAFKRVHYLFTTALRNQELENDTNPGPCPLALQRMLLEIHDLSKDLLEQTRVQVKTLARVEEFEENDAEQPDLAAASQSKGGGAGSPGGD